MTAADLKLLRSSGLVDVGLVNALETKIPPGINLKQLIFFGVLDGVLGTPRPSQSLRAKLMDAHDQMVLQLKRPLGLLELRKLVLAGTQKAVDGLLTQLRDFGKASRLQVLGR